MNTNEISQEVLDGLKDSLPHGSMQKIAEKADCTYNYVYLVLRGRIGLNENSRKVIEAAMSIIKEAQQEVAELEREITEVTFKRPEQL